MDVLGNGMQNFAAGSDDEGTKIDSGIGDNERMNKGNWRGTFKDWVYAIVDGGMGFWTEMDWREAGVVVRV